MEYFGCPCKGKKKGLLAKLFHLWGFYGKLEKIQVKVIQIFLLGSISFIHTQLPNSCPLAERWLHSKALGWLLPTALLPLWKTSTDIPKQHFGLIWQVFTHAPLTAGALPLEN